MRAIRKNRRRNIMQTVANNNLPPLNFIDVYFLNSKNLAIIFIITFLIITIVLLVQTLLPNDRMQYLECVDRAMENHSISAAVVTYFLVNRWWRQMGWLIEILVKFHHRLHLEINQKLHTHSHITARSTKTHFSWAWTNATHKPRWRQKTLCLSFFFSKRNFVFSILFSTKKRPIQPWVINKMFTPSNAI